MPSEFAQALRHEESIYSILTPLQGIRVPVALGSLNLRRTFSYDGIAEIGHFLFLSNAGRPIKEHRIDHRRLTQETEDSIKAIHKLGVSIATRMLATCFGTKRTRSRCLSISNGNAGTTTKPTGLVSRDQKCKRRACTWEISPNKRPKTPNCFEREPERMRSDEKRNNNDTQLPN